MLSDVTLIRPVRGFALTYLEVLFLTRAKRLGLGCQVLVYGKMMSPIQMNGL